MRYGLFSNSPNPIHHDDWLDSLDERLHLSLIHI